MPTTPEQIADLIGGYTDLKQYFENVRDDVEQRVAAKEAEVDQFLQDAMPETKYIQDITLGGSVEFFYPVWFRFPEASSGASRLTVCRYHTWNGSEGERPLDPNSSAQAGLLLELEGAGYSWGGGAKFFEAKRHTYTYNQTLSHVAFRGYCKWENTGTVDYLPPEHDLRAINMRFSSVYLRGGGLRYRIIKNWPGDVNYSDLDQRVDIFDSATHGTWYAEPISFSNILEPTVHTNAYVDPV